MARLYYVIASIVCTPLVLLANIEITSVTNASNFDLSSSPPVIYGGTAGPDTDGTCASKDGSATCNNCVNATTECNENRVYGTLDLIITFNVTGDVSSAQTPYFKDDSDADVTGVTTSNFSDTTLQNGDSATFTVDWGRLCDHIESDSDVDCTDQQAGSQTFRIGVDADGDGTLESGEYSTFSLIYSDPEGNASSTPGTITCADTEDDGICSFEAFHGDEKVFIKDVTSLGSFPTAANVSVDKARVYYVEWDGSDGTIYDDVNYTTGTFEDLDIIDDGSNLDESKITGLANGSFYSFKIAMVDLAGNISFLTDDTQISGTTGCPAVGVNYTDGSTEATSCPYIADPDEVFGILEEACVVATVAKGTPFEKHANLLRQFRDNILIKHPLGKKITQTYYTYTRYPASWVRDSEFLKSVTRAALMPGVGFAWVSLHWSFTWAVTLTVALLLGLTLLSYYTFTFRKRLSHRG